MHKFNKRGQGTTEYVIILALVVAIAVYFFNSNIGTNVKAKINQVATDIGSAGTPNP